MTIRGIAFDVDGTLYDYHDRKIHESTIEAIRQAHEKGIIIIIATARSYAELNTICQQELEVDYYIGASGHSILDSGSRSIYSEHFSLEQTDRMISIARKCDIGLTLKYDHINCLYSHFDAMKSIYSNIGESCAATLRCEKQDYHLKELPIGFAIWGEDGKRDHVAKMLSQYPNDYRLELFRNGVVADVFLPSVSKLTALQYLCGRLGFEADSIMTFGDSINDIGMTKWAGMGVAMGHGRDELKQHADYICETGWENGIAHTIEKFAL